MGKITGRLFGHISLNHVVKILRNETNHGLKKKLLMNGNGIDVVLLALTLVNKI